MRLVEGVRGKLLPVLPDLYQNLLVMTILDTEYSKPLYHSSTVDKLIETVKEHNFVPVVDDRGCFIGIILRRSVLDFLHGYYTNKETQY